MNVRITIAIDLRSGANFSVHGGLPWIFGVRKQCVNRSFLILVTVIFEREESWIHGKKIFLHGV